MADRLDGLEEIDGPMLKHGLQGFQGQRLRVVPSAARLKPNREFLEERYADKACETSRSHHSQLLTFGCKPRSGRASSTRR